MFSKPVGISEAVRNEANPKERVSIKCNALVKTGVIKSGKVGDLDIRILSVTRIEQGIEILARVWQNGIQIGFGPDGSVDVERFRIINPPILIRRGDVYIEDPQSAVLHSLAHTIQVKKEKHGPDGIIKDKVGSTTTTIYPHATANGWDGAISRSQSASTFASLRDGNGTAINNAASAIAARVVAAGSLPNGFTVMTRSIFDFDTSVIGSGQTVSAVTLSLKKGSTAGQQEQGKTGFDLGINAATVASHTAGTATDFENSKDGASWSSTTITWDDWEASSGYNDFAGNAAFVAGVNVTGNTAVAFRCGWDRNNSYTGNEVGENSVGTRITVSFAETTGTTDDPKLVVEHAATPSGSSATLHKSSAISLSIGI